MNARTPEEERNLAFATEAYSRVLTRFDPTEIDRYFAIDYVQHGSLAADGREGLRAFIEQARCDFPDAKIEIVRSFVDGEFVIFHVRGQLAPAQPVAAVVDMFRVGNGLIQEHWEVIQELPTALPHRNGSF